MKKMRKIFVILLVILGMVTFVVSCDDKVDPAVQELADAKTTAISQLESYKNASDYYPTEQNALTAAITAGKAEINAATTEVEVAMALNAAKVAIDAIKTKAKVDAETATALAAAKATAITAIEGYVDEDDYNEDEQADLTAAIAAGKVAINAATTEAAVTTALNAAKAAIDAIPTSEEVALEELADAKTDAIAVLETYADPDDYYEAGKTALATAVEAGKTAINAATTLEAVENALGTAKDAINAIDTAAAIDDAFATFKSNAKNEINAHYNETDYSPEGLTAIQGIVNLANAAIDAATTEAEVTAAVTDAKDDIDEVPLGVKVFFNTNGGSEVTTLVIKSGAAPQAPANPTRGGYEFTGWYSDEELTVEFIFENPITENTTVYAKWQSVLGGEIVYYNDFSESQVVGTDVLTEGVYYSVTTSGSGTGDNSVSVVDGQLWVKDTHSSNTTNAHIAYQLELGIVYLQFDFIPMKKNNSWTFVQLYDVNGSEFFGFRTASDKIGYRLNGGDPVYVGEGIGLAYSANDVLRANFTIDVLSGLVSYILLNVSTEAKVTVEDIQCELNGFNHIRFVTAGSATDRDIYVDNVIIGYTEEEFEIIQNVFLTKMETLKNSFVEQQYSTSNWNTLVAAYNSAIQAINGAETGEAVLAAYYVGNTAMKGVNSLITDSVNALTEVYNQMVESGDYSNNLATLKSTYDAAVKFIKDITDFANFETESANAHQSLEAVLSNADMDSLAAEILEKLSDLADEYDALVATEDYTTNAAELTLAYQDGCALIEAAETFAELPKAYDAALELLADVLSDSQIAFEAAKPMYTVVETRTTTDVYGFNNPTSATFGTDGVITQVDTASKNGLDTGKKEFEGVQYNGAIKTGGKTTISSSVFTNYFKIELTEKANLLVVFRASGTGAGSIYVADELTLTPTDKYALKDTSDNSNLYGFDIALEAGTYYLCYTEGYYIYNLTASVVTVETRGFEYKVDSMVLEESTEYDSLVGLTIAQAYTVKLNLVDYEDDVYTITDFSDFKFYLDGVEVDLSTVLTAGEHTLKVVYTAEDGRFSESELSLNLLTLDEILALAKNAAKDELNAYADPADYLADGRTSLQDAITLGCDQIDLATTTIEIENALVVAKAAIDLIKTAADVTKGTISSLFEEKYGNITGDEVTLPAELNGFALSYVLMGTYVSVEITDGKLSITPDIDLESVELEVTLTKGDEVVEFVIVFSTQLVLNTHAEYMAATTGTVLYLRAQVTGVNFNTSSKLLSVILQDNNGGYYINLPSANPAYIEAGGWAIVGNDVSFIGTRDVTANAMSITTFELVSINETGKALPEAVDISADIESEEDLTKYQGMRVTAEVIYLGGTGLTTGSKNIVYYWNAYWGVATNPNATLEVGKVYIVDAVFFLYNTSNQFAFYGSFAKFTETTPSSVYIIDYLVTSELKDLFDSSYTASDVVELPTTSTNYTGYSFTYAVTGDTANINGVNLEITPTNTEVTVVLSVTVKRSDNSDFLVKIEFKTKLPETGEVEYNYSFVNTNTNLSTIFEKVADGGWGTSYDVRKLSSGLFGFVGPNINFNFSRAAIQTGSSSIIDRPVMAINKDIQTTYLNIDLLDADLQISGVTILLKQWGTYTYTKVVLEYFDGENWEECSAPGVYDVSGEMLLESSEIPAGITKVRVSAYMDFSSSGNRQIGLTSVSLSVKPTE